MVVWVMTATLTPRRAEDTSNGYSIWLEVLLIWAEPCRTPTRRMRDPAPARPNRQLQECIGSRATVEPMTALAIAVGVLVVRNVAGESVVPPALYVPGHLATAGFFSPLGPPPRGVGGGRPR